VIEVVDFVLSTARGDWLREENIGLDFNLSIIKSDNFFTVKV
jgi:hypothetical protein